jgi:hypothetical protein
MSDVKTATVSEPEIVDEKALGENGQSAHSSSGEIEYLPLSAKDDRILTTKIDLRVLPICGLIFLVCFLDRTNIANARLAGLQEGFHMPSNGYNTALWIFYIPFVLAEIPSNSE